MLSQERGEHAGCAGGSSNLVAAAGAASLTITYIRRRLKSVM